MKMQFANFYWDMNGFLMDKINARTGGCGATVTQPMQLDGAQGIINVLNINF